MCLIIPFHAVYCSRPRSQCATLCPVTKAWFYFSLSTVAPVQNFNPPRRQLAMFGDIFDCHNAAGGWGCCWRLVDSEGAAWQRTASTTKDYPFQSVHSVEVEEPCLSRPLLSPVLPSCVGHLLRGQISHLPLRCESTCLRLFSPCCYGSWSGRRWGPGLHSSNAGTWCVFPYTRTKQPPRGSEVWALLGQLMDYAGEHGTD
ncbi:hypothetical protein HJG60_010343 [Phyllostomus discolor]|uniref:Uncharacterized protein n=1 Tax=Phyllostomus discolor TaxID=89673 RepID=A0A834EKA5_9CHIR|nr:hypothetical protein HJG60_010343 [Phyllostomus discolor]